MISRLDNPESIRTARTFPRARASVQWLLLLALLSTISLLPAVPAGATVGDHPNSETPGSKLAVIFSPFGPLSADDKASMDYIKSKVEDHNYKVTLFLDDTEAGDNQPKDATAAKFRKLRNKGLVYIVTHGDQDDPATAAVEPNLLLIEVYKRARARNNAFAAYGAPFVAGDLVKCDQFGDHPGNSIFGICITEQGVKNHFKDKNTIVHVAACFSMNFVQEFNAREYFGYNAASTCPNIKGDTQKLWGRMHGEVDDGHHRAARKAFEAGGFTAIFAFQHKAGLLDTVLSPAVRRHKPQKDEVLMVPITTNGLVRFDTRMDTTVDPASVISIVGCEGVIKDPKWDPPYALRFKLELKTPGDAELTVRASKARAERIFKNKLDGNLIPAKDHVGPNRDDFKWRIKCVAPTPTPTWTPTQTSVLPPPTNSQTNTPTATSTSTSTPTGTNTPTPTSTNTFTPTSLPSATATATSTGVCYGLSLGVNPPNSGEVDANPPPNCGGNYLPGTEVTLTAFPNDGVDFAGWTGSVNTTTNPIQLTMNGNKSMQANFVPK